MKKLIGVYIVIGLFLVPFIYSNNAEGYRDSKSGSYQWGSAIGSSFFWPSYLFSIEPEVNSDSLKSFQESIVEILNYRNSKLFTGKRSQEDSYMVMESLGYCLAINGLRGEKPLSLYEDLFKKSINSKELNSARKNIMEKMDGYDFADIIEEGAECAEKLGSSE